jgi:putative membrane protein
MIMSMLIAWIVITIAVVLASYLLPGVEVKDLKSAVVAAAVLGILNALLKPILVFLTIPITFLTLGLFLIVINAAMFYLAAALVEGFRVRSFGWALGGALVVSVVSIVANWII